MSLKGKNIIIGVSSSIACYKSANLARTLVKMGANVQVIMTKNAMNFISPITFDQLTGRKCLTDTFERPEEIKVEHVSLANWADAVVIAPASANTLAKMAHGLADDMLSTTVLACNCVKLAAPAMNTKMYENPITQDNLATLKKYGFKLIEPEEGLLACGDIGKGKMADEETIIAWIEREISCEKDMVGKKVLLTSGPTREALDPVRYITNHSTGKMGAALAKVAMMRGAEVTVISGKAEAKMPEFVKVVPVTSAKEMYDGVMERISEQDIVIMAAAVADYRPKEVASEKIKKKDGDNSIALERTDDILATAGANRKPGQFLCGFSMETENMLENSTKKLEKKNVDMIVANNLKTAGAGFGTDTNVVTLITKEGPTELPQMSKEEVAEKIFDKILGK